MTISTHKRKTALGSSGGLKWNDQKGKCWRRHSTSGNELTRGSISLWRGHVLIWTTRTGLLCRHFGVLFVESMRLGYVGSKTSPGHGSMVLATLYMCSKVFDPRYRTCSTNLLWASWGKVTLLVVKQTKSRWCGTDIPCQGFFWRWRIYPPLESLLPSFESLSHHYS